MPCAAGGLDTGPLVSQAASIKAPQVLRMSFGRIDEGGQAVKSLSSKGPFSAWTARWTMKGLGRGDEAPRGEPMWLVER